MTKYNNEGIDLREFPYQLTEWLAEEGDLTGVIKSLQQYGDEYGKYYIIKRDSVTHYFAVFTKGKRIAELEASRLYSATQKATAKWAEIKANLEREK